MDDDIDTLVGHIEEPVRLDHLQALVHESCAVHRDFGPHVPGGMGERLLYAYGTQFVERGLAERSSRSGQDESLDLVSFFTTQALPDGTVLAVHGEHAYLRNPCRPHDNVA